MNKGHNNIILLLYNYEKRPSYLAFIQNTSVVTVDMKLYVYIV